MRMNVLVFLLVAVVTTSVPVMAVTLTMLPVTNAGLRNDGGASYHVQGMTDDGAYVVASKNNGTKNCISFIKVSDGSVTYIDPTGRVSGGRGIGMAPGGIAGAGCAETNIAASPLALGVDAGATASKYIGTDSEQQVAPFNAMALNSTTGDGWIAGNRDVHGPEALAWHVVAGVVPTTPTYSKVGVSGDAGFSGVSTTGIAIGSDNSGPSGKEHAILADVAANGNAYQVAAFAGSSGRSAGYGISNNGAFGTGYMYPAATATPDTFHAFRNTVLGNTTVELLPAGGDDLTLVQQSAAYDIADDGTAAGFSWKGKYANGTPTTNYRATIWLAGSTSGVLLEDILASAGVSLGDFAYLERCVSITADGKTIAGRGVLTSDGSYRGFVVNIPEPASLSLLALGGLALLRRRS